jgi:predicted ATPase/DNA-binding CsgD family transcriptional regulator
MTGLSSTSATTAPNNLPRELTSFVGREREIAQVSDLLDNTALLTLTGVGGAGKTRLALRVATDLAERFPDGVWLVELAALTDSTLVSRTVAAAFGVSKDPQRSPAETVAEHLRPRRLLLLLDNCEQVVEACAELADRLLRACPELKVITTSREPLGIAGETTWLVPSLTTPDPSMLATAREPAAALEQHEAVRLFVERARAARPNFRVNDDNAFALAQICHRLDGIPLAIELAAARVKGLSLEQIAARLDQRFELLTGGSRTALPRQRTLRAMTDWSYDLLTADEQALLRRLAVFGNGWTLDAAEAVCREGVFDGLMRLIDKSLVVTHGDSGNLRYSYLETVRQYAEEKLRESGEESEYRLQQCEWCIDFAQRAEPYLRRANQAEWCARLESELDNIRTALAWCRGAPERYELGVRLAGTLSRFWDLQGHMREGREILEALLPATSDRTRARANALIELGWLPTFMGDATTAEGPLAEALALSRELEYPLGMVAALAGQGYALARRGELAAAAAAQDEAITIARRIGDDVTIWPALYQRAETARRQGDHHLAESLLEEALTVAQGLGEHWRRLAAASLARVLLDLGDHERVQAVCRERLTACAGRLDERGTLHLLEALAAAATAQGQSVRAARLFGVAEAAHERLGASLSFFTRDDHDRAVARARSLLGDTGFEAAWDEGRSMSVEQAITCALGQAEPSRPSAASRAESPLRQIWAPLTGREAEVAKLVAQGLTNAQIAQGLVITEKTAANHVQNILDKLDFRSRAQIAGWAVDRGLLSESPP